MKTCLSLVLVAIGYGQATAAEQPSVKNSIQVDSAVHELSRCRLKAVTFRNEKEGWATDACGKAFHTISGGVSWQPTADAALNFFEPSYEQLTQFYWATDRVGVGAGTMSGRVVRTEDGGKHWKWTNLPAEQRVASLEGIGSRIWICGAGGQIVRSDDGGATWKGIGSPFTNRDHCSALSFVDGNRGWAGGDNGTLWSTVDGGSTWSSIHAPGGRIEKVLLLDQKTSWVAAGQAAFLTTDRGTSWETVRRVDAPIIDKSQAERLPGVRADNHVVLMGESADSERRIPQLGVQVVSRGPQAAVLLGPKNNLLYFYDKGALARAAPLLSSAGGKREGLIESRPLTPLRSYGWSRDHVYLSEDGGKSWFVRSNAPAKMLDSVVFVSADRAVAKKGNVYFRSDDAAATWSVSKSPSLDEHEASVVEAERQGLKATSKNPLSCLLQAKEGRLLITLGSAGCLGSLIDQGTELRLTFKNGSSVFEGSVGDRSDSRNHVGPSPLDAVATEAFVSKLISAVEKREVASGSWSTVSNKASIRWSCARSGANSSEEQVSFQSSDFNAEGSLDLDQVPGSQATPVHYARALGVAGVANTLLTKGKPGN